MRMRSSAQRPRPPLVSKRLPPLLREFGFGAQIDMTPLPPCDSILRRAKEIRSQKRKIGLPEKRKRKLDL
eukprot:scaffold5021_cov96-Amphora_coffeaeformis.AAC.1